MEFNDNNILNFISEVQSTVEADGISFILSPTKHVIIVEEGHIKCNGYFDPRKKVLRCAIKKPINQWLPILVHEFSHFEQYKSNCPSWQRLIYKGKDIGDKYYLWLKGRKISNEIASESFIRVRNIELDCEKRSVKNIIKYKLPIDVEDYIRAANAYIYFYNFAHLTRSWYKKGKVPYDLEEIKSHMPSHFVSRYDRLPKKYHLLFEKYCT